MKWFVFQHSLDSGFNFLDTLLCVEVVWVVDLVANNDKGNVFLGRFVVLGGISMPR